MRHIFNQYFGLGDILFIEPILRKFWQKGDEVIMPVLPQFMDLQPYFPYVTFVNKETFDIDYECKQIVKTEDTIIYPVRWSKEFFDSKSYSETMRNKYKMFDLPLDTWRQLTWLRHRWKEQKLIEYLQLDISKPYTLINRQFHTFDNNIRQIPVKGVEMRIIEGFTLLDWASIIENATEIHTVNTSILYLLETLDLKCKEINFYSRNSNGIDFKNINYLMSKKYKLWK